MAKSSGLIVGVSFVLSVIIFGQIARFPIEVVTDQQLKAVRDRAQTTTNAALNATATTLTVVSGAKFAANMIVTIDSEQISICAVSGATFTVGHSSCPNVDGRGFNGTAAAAHPSGSLVSGYLTSWNVNAPNAELKAIETFLMASATVNPRVTSAAELVAAAASAPIGSVITVTAPIILTSQVSLGKSVTLECAAGARITASGWAGAVVVIAASDVSVIGCPINGGGVAHPLIGATGSNSNIRIIGNVLTNSAADALWIQSGSNIHVSNNVISGNKSTGINIGGPNIGTLEKIVVANNVVDDTGCTAQYCGSIGVWGNHVTISNNVVWTGGNQSQGIVWLRNTTDRGNDGTITGNTVHLSSATAFECIGIGSVDNFSITGNTCEATGYTSTGVIGIEVNQSNNGTVAGNQVWGNGANPMTGITLESASGVAVTGNAVKGWGNSGTGIFLMVATISLPLSNNLVADNILINTGIGTDSEIMQESFAAGMMANNVYHGNVVAGNQTPGHTCIKLANSSSATSIGHSITENRLNNCDTGIQVVGTSLEIARNRMTNIASAKISDLGTATMLDDSNGVPFSFLANQANGSKVYCTDCNVACSAGSSSGRTCFRENGAWTH